MLAPLDLPCLCTPRVCTNSEFSVNSPLGYADDHHGSLQRTWTPRVDAESRYSRLAPSAARVLKPRRAPQDPPNLRSALHTDPSHRRGPSRYAGDHLGGLQRTWTPCVDAGSR